jgi:hypothetical protein
MKRYYEYDTETRLKRLSPPLSESDLLEAPSHIKYFTNKEEFELFIQIHQDLTSNENHINHNKGIENATSMKQDTSDETFKQIDGPETQITETITPSVKQWGGRRSGSGSKKGQLKTAETKDKMRLAKIGNKNAVKSK